MHVCHLRSVIAAVSTTGAPSLMDRALPYSPIEYGAAHLDAKAAAQKQRYICFGSAAQSSNEPIQPPQPRAHGELIPHLT